MGVFSRDIVQSCMSVAQYWRLLRAVSIAHPHPHVLNIHVHVGWRRSTVDGESTGPSIERGWTTY